MPRQGIVGQLERASEVNEHIAWLQPAVIHPCKRTKIISRSESATCNEHSSTNIKLVVFSEHRAAELDINAYLSSHYRVKTASVS